jgi:hypothetical protein
MTTELACPHKRGRKSFPNASRRRLLFGRVDPETESFLLSLQAPNMGRAIDLVVHLLVQQAYTDSSSMSR